MGQRTCNDQILKFVVFCERMLFYQQQLFGQFSTDVGHTYMLNVPMDCKLIGCTAESGVPICHLPIRVALQLWSGVIRVITCTNGIHVFRSPYCLRFVPPEKAFVRPCNNERRVLPCPSALQSSSVSAFVHWCYNGVTRIELRERIRRTAAGDAVLAQVFVRTWFASWYVPLQ